MTLMTEYSYRKSYFDDEVKKIKALKRSGSKTMPGTFLNHQSLKDNCRNLNRVQKPSKTDKKVKKIQEHLQNTSVVLYRYWPVGARYYASLYDPLRNLILEMRPHMREQRDLYLRALGYKMVFLNFSGDFLWQDQLDEIYGDGALGKMVRIPRPKKSPSIGKEELGHLVRQYLDSGGSIDQIVPDRK